MNQQSNNCGFDKNENAQALGTGARLLVAEDDPVLRSLVTSTLLDEGYDVYEAASADTLRTIVSSVTPDILPAGGIDLVLSDICMPGTSGLDVIRQLRSSGWSTPVILMTAFPDPAIVAAVRRAGIPLLRKPFSLRVLVDAVVWALMTRAFPKPRQAATKV